MRQFMVVIWLSLTLILAACSGISPERQATLEAARTLTASHEPEVRAVIEDLESVRGSLESVQDSAVLLEVMTGPALESGQSFEFEPGDEVLVTREIMLDEVRVLEYSSTLIRAVGCGHKKWDEVTYDGEYIISLPQRPFRVYYIFVWEDDTWKLDTGTSYRTVLKKE